MLTPSGLGEVGVIRWTAPANGTFAVRIQSLDPAVAGTDVSYEFEITLENRVNLPAIMK